MKVRDFINILCVGVLFTTSGYAKSLWHCTAKNSQEAEWSFFSEDHRQANAGAKKQCESNSHPKKCAVICIPPRDYWRCVAHDTPQLTTKNHDKINTLEKPGAWYWTSYSKSVAINGARDACVNNSQQGGCVVNPNACAMS